MKIISDRIRINNHEIEQRDRYRRVGNRRIKQRRLTAKQIKAEVGRINRALERAGITYKVRIDQ